MYCCFAPKCVRCRESLAWRRRCDLPGCKYAKRTGRHVGCRSYQKRKNGSPLPVQALGLFHDMPRFYDHRASSGILSRGDDSDHFSAVICHAGDGLHQYPAVLVSIVVAADVEGAAAASELAVRCRGWGVSRRARAWLNTMAVKDRSRNRNSTTCYCCSCYNM